MSPLQVPVTGYTKKTRILRDVNRLRTKRGRKRTEDEETPRCAVGIYTTKDRKKINKVEVEEVPSGVERSKRPHVEVCEDLV